MTQDIFIITNKNMNSAHLKVKMEEFWWKKEMHSEKKTIM